MKKITIAALLIVATLFVGCSVGAQLLGFAWTSSWTQGGQTLKEVWEFESGNNFRYEYYLVGEKEDTLQYEGSGTWVCVDNILTISGDDKNMQGCVGEWTVTIEGDVLTMERTDGKVLSLERVKE